MTLDPLPRRVLKCAGKTLAAGTLLALTSCLFSGIGNDSPFWIFGKSVEEKARDGAEEQRKQGSGPSAASSARTPDEAQREQLRRENERIQQELAERSRAQPQSGPPPSIGDELAALERALGKRSPSSEARPVHG